MNLTLFIASRLLKRNRGGFSNPIIRIAIVAVALSLAVMILAIAIVTGFQNQIREKVIGFGGHIQVTRYDANSSFEVLPMSRNQPFVNQILDQPGVRHIQVFATKPGIIRTDKDIQGIVLKGVDPGFDWSFFDPKIIQGQKLYFPDTAATNGVLISKKLATLLQLKTGDNASMYFIIDQLVRARRFTIEGIYDTGLEEFDKMFVLCDIRHIQRLNGWGGDEVAGFEVLVNDFNKLEPVTEAVYQVIGSEYNALSIKEIYPQLFDWLKLQDMNVIIVLSLMVLVAVITMVSALLIIILERTKTIGIFKALGYENNDLRKVFLVIASIIALKGMFWGNAFGVAMALLQKYYGIIKLSEESYYVSVIPIELNWLNLLLLNAGTLIICLLVMIIPSVVISSISPVKTLRFE